MLSEYFFIIFFHNMMSSFWFILVGLIALRALAFHYPDVENDSAALMLTFTSLLLIVINFFMTPTISENTVQPWVASTLVVLAMLIFFPGAGNFVNSALRVYNAGGGLPIAIIFDHQKKGTCPNNSRENEILCQISGFSEDFTIYPLKLLAGDYIYVGAPISKPRDTKANTEEVVNQSQEQPIINTISINREAVNGIIFLKPEKSK
jgi:hypothetical protein